MGHNKHTHTNSKTHRITTISKVTLLLEQKTPALAGERAKVLAMNIHLNDKTLYRNPINSIKHKAEARQDREAL